MVNILLPVAACWLCIEMTNIGNFVLFLLFTVPIMSLNAALSSTATLSPFGFDSPLPERPPQGWGLQCNSGSHAVGY